MSTQLLQLMAWGFLQLLRKNHSPRRRGIIEAKSKGFEIICKRYINLTKLINKIS